MPFSVTLSANTYQSYLNTMTGLWIPQTLANFSLISGKSTSRPFNSVYTHHQLGLTVTWRQHNTNLTFKMMLQSTELRRTEIYRIIKLSAGTMYGRPGSKK
jgi:hypothetical protein